LSTNRLMHQKLPIAPTHTVQVTFTNKQ